MTTRLERRFVGRERQFSVRRPFIVRTGGEKKEEGREERKVVRRYVREKPDLR